MEHKLIIKILLISILFLFKCSMSAPEREVKIVNGKNAAVGEAEFIVQFRYIVTKSHACAGFEKVA